MGVFDSTGRVGEDLKDTVKSPRGARGVLDGLPYLAQLLRKHGGGHGGLLEQLLVLARGLVQLFERRRPSLQVFESLRR